MKCSDMEQWFGESLRGVQAPLPKEALEHVADCPPCKALLEVVEQQPHDRPIPEDLERRIRSQVLGSLTPVPSIRSHFQRVLGFLGGFFALALAAFWIMGINPMEAFSVPNWPWIALVLAGGAVAMAISFSLQMEPGRRILIPPPVVLLAVAVAYGLALMSLVPWNEGGSWTEFGPWCLKYGLMVATPGAAVFWLLARRGVILRPMLMGASLGLMAGLVGATVMHFACLMNEARHQVAWHTAIPVAGLVAGYSVAGLGRVLGFGGTRRRTKP